MKKVQRLLHCASFKSYTGISRAITMKTGSAPVRSSLQNDAAS